MKASRISALALTGLALLLLLGNFLSAQASPNNPANSLDPQSKIQNLKSKIPNDQAPYHMSVQGRLTDAAGQPISGTLAVTFRLYDAPSGGSEYYSETSTISPAAQGLFTYNLGSNGDLGSVLGLFNFRFYLGISVGGDAEMTPRTELTAAPYAMSLAPGALITGAVAQSGMVNGYNSDTSSSYSAGLVGRGVTGVHGDTIYDGPQTSSGGDFFNYGGGSGQQFGVNSVTLYGFGVYGESSESSDTQQSAGVAGHSGQMGGGGGVFTGTNGVVGYADLSSGAGGVFVGQGAMTNSLGLQVYGMGQATGGFSTGGGYSLIVRYNGSSPLQPGDVLALDGNNAMLDGATILGTSRATATNAAASIGVAQARYILDTTTGLPQLHPDAAHAIQPGDFVQVVVVGQARVSVSGKVQIGDRLSLDAAGHLSVAIAGAETIGKVASLPDADGRVLIFVIFR